MTNWWNLLSDLLKLVWYSVLTIAVLFIIFYDLLFLIAVLDWIMQSLFR